MGSTTSRRLANQRAALKTRKKQRNKQQRLDDVIVFAEEKVSHDGHERGYSDIYDSRYCLTCNVWLEAGCADPACHYCSKRPATPQEAEKNGTLATDDDDYIDD